MTHHNLVPRHSSLWRMLRRSVLMAVVVGVLLGCLEPAMACPNCKDALAESGTNGMNLVKGYYWSILFMMSMPFLLLASLGTYFYWEVRRARNRLAAVAPPMGPPAADGLAWKVADAR